MKLKWIPKNNPPTEDTRCFAICRRLDGSTYIPYYPVFYTTGIHWRIEDPLFVGFLHHDVVAWMPIPEPAGKDRNGWAILGVEDPPETKVSTTYIVSSYDQKANQERVELAVYNPDKANFFGHPEVVAWREIPKYKEAKL